MRRSKSSHGYAPFCKLHVYRNWTSTRCLTVPVTAANRHLLRSDYEARNSGELPVLVRWFEGVEPPVASYLIPILYSREQLAKEGSAIDADWGVVGCMYTSEPAEIPMAPITMMRNALGVAAGRLRRGAGRRGLPPQRRVLERARQLALNSMSALHAFRGSGASGCSPSCWWR